MEKPVDKYLVISSCHVKLSQTKRKKDKKTFPTMATNRQEIQDKYLRFQVILIRLERFLLKKPEGPNAY